MGKYFATLQSAAANKLLPNCSTEQNLCIIQSKRKTNCTGRSRKTTTHQQPFLFHTAWRTLFRNRQQKSNRKFSSGYFIGKNRNRKSKHRGKNEGTSLSSAITR